MLGHHVTRAHPHGLAGQHDRADHGRVRRPVIRCVPPRRGDVAPLRRRQRLRRQGPLRRSDRRAARITRPSSSPRRTSSPATSSAMARTAGELFLRGVVGERFCVRNSGADCRRRGRRRPRVRVHDRGHRPSSSARPAATSRPACPAALPTSSTCDPSSSTSSWSTSRACGRMTRRPSGELLTDHVAVDRVARRPSPAR